ATIKPKPFKRLTDAEFADKRAKGICFRCDEKFGPEHRSLGKTLQVLLVGEEDEIEDELDERSDELVHLDMVEILLNSVMGFTSPHTMKIQGIIGHEEVVVLIDSGATHNFLSRRVLKRLGLLITGGGSISVMLGNGKFEKSQGICKGVLITFQELQILEDFYPLDLGDPGLCRSLVSYKALVRSFQKEKGGFLVEMKSLEESSESLIKQPEEHHQLLAEFKDVFHLPRTRFSAQGGNNTNYRNAYGHKEHLKTVFAILRRHGLYANKKKCLFFQTWVEYLGHIVTGEGVSADPSKSKAMKFMKGYGKIALALTEKLKKDNFSWLEEATQSFEALKDVMTRVTVLALPDFNKEFVVESDAYGKGVGAVLMQEGRPVAYFSQYQKWLVKLMGYDFSIQYMPGKENEATDALSRKDEIILGALLQSLELPDKVLDEITMDFINGLIINTSRLPCITIKEVIGTKVAEPVLLVALTEDMEVILQPEEVLGIHKGSNSTQGSREALNHWKNLPGYEAT
ncbi:putative mitochondrial protein, partial [Tanacetum coccineum]